MGKIWKTFNVILLLTLIISYQVGISAFTHSHVIGGVYIAHSHPAKDKPNHSHTPEQIVTIAHLNNVLTTAPEMVSLDLSAPVLELAEPVFFYISRTPLAHEWSIYKRGPPTSVIAL